MPVSKAQQKAVNKYVRENYDKLLLTMPKGRKAEIQAHAQAQGESVNGFIGRAISETIEHDSSPTAPVQASPQTPETPQDDTLVLMERGQISTGSGEIKTLYTAFDTGRKYYVEPVISDSEWNDLQKAKDASADDPDELPF